ncbi:IS4 family transposase, partial [Fischerella thermalis CCMEE 5273]
MMELLKQTRTIGVKASYVLFDSWFSFPMIIKKVHDQGIPVICMLKSMPKVRYGYQEQKPTLDQLYQTVRKKRGRAKIVASVIVSLGENEKGEDVQAKIVFVRNRRQKKQWLALLTTDLELSDEETVRIYGKRWDIEVFFKMIKSYLGLAKEFQGRSYDRMVAHTSIVYTRYLLLAIESREACDPRTLGNLFYLCCDELEDLKFATAL